MYLASRAHLNFLQKRADNLEELYQLAVKSSKETDFAFRQLLDKTVTMLGTKDPMSYQQVMAMNQQVMTMPDAPVYDMSDYGEYMKEKLGPHEPGFDDESDDEIDVLAREIGLTN